MWVEVLDLPFFPVFSALESKLVSQFCEDENGALIYNHIANGPWNGNNGFVLNGINQKNSNGYNGYERSDYDYRNSGYGNNFQEEIQNQRQTNSRGRGDTFTLPISADPLQVFISLHCFTYTMMF